MTMPQPQPGIQAEGGWSGINDAGGSGCFMVALGCATTSAPISTDKKMKINTPTATPETRAARRAAITLPISYNHLRGFRLRVRAAGGGRRAGSAGTLP